MVEFIGGREVHPVASIFPMMGEDELSALAADIRDNGQQSHVVVAWADESMTETILLDGRNRSRACEMLGTEPNVELFSSVFIPLDDFGPMIVSWNLHRRHLSASQRAMIAVEYERVFAEQAKKRQLAQLAQNRDGDTVGEILPQREPEDRGPRATDEAGDLFNVSGRTVRDAKYVSENDPDLAEKVKADEVSVSAAAKGLRGKGKPEPTEQELAHRDAQRLAKKGNAYLKALLAELIELIGDE